MPVLQLAPAASPLPHDAPRPTADEERTRRYASISAGFVAALAALVLTGWTLDVPLLTTGLPGLPAMKAATAACFVLLAAATALLCRPGARRTGSVALAVGAGAVAKLSLWAGVLGPEAVIPGLLAGSLAFAEQAVTGGLMAPDTAVAFLLTAGAVASAGLGSRAGGWLTAGLALAAGLLALVAVVGYVSGVTSPSAVTGFAEMALLTSIAFIVLTAGILCTRPRGGPMPLLLGDTIGARVVRVLFPATLVVPLALGALRLAGQSAGLFDPVTGAWLFALAIVFLLTPLTWALGASLHRAELASAHAHEAREETQREKAAFDDAPIGSALIALDGRFERVNRALCAMTGFTAQELIGMPVADVIHAADRAAASDGYAALAHGDRPVLRADIRFVHRCGDTVHVRAAVTAMRSGGERVSHFYAQMQDVTESKTAARRLEEAQFETLTRLAAAAEYRDDDTGEHTRRVGDMAGRIAERLGLPHETVRLIKLAAPLHDVGKIGIPDRVLLKPGRLTREEFDHMKRHTSIGAQMLSGSVHPQMTMAAQIAASHHERWDGAGYPAGLAGEAIPLAGRIVAVADVFDALTHARPYKDAWPQDAALAELRHQRGRQFDPQVVDALLSLMPATTQEAPLPQTTRA